MDQRALQLRVIIWWQLSPTQAHRVLQQFGTKMIADEFQNDEGVCGLRAVDWVRPIFSPFDVPDIHVLATDD